MCCFTGQPTSHNIMNSNSMFLLDLASAAGCGGGSALSSLPQFKSRQNADQQNARMPSSAGAAAAPTGGLGSNASSAAALSNSLQTTSNLSAVDELLPLDPNPFPLVPFQCFQV